jgi:hypothetical protein
MSSRTSHIPASFFEIQFKIILLYTLSGRGSSVGTATRYMLEGPEMKSRWWARYSAPVQTGPTAYPTSYTMGTGSFPGVERQGRGVDHPPLFRAEFKESVKLYLYYYPSGPSWPLIG